MLRLHKIKALIFSLCHFPQAPILPKTKIRSACPFNKVFLRDSTNTTIYKILHFIKDRGKSLGSMIPSKGLKEILGQKKRTQLFPRPENAVLDAVTAALEKLSFGWQGLCTWPSALQTTLTATNQLHHP